MDTGIALAGILEKKLDTGHKMWRVLVIPNRELFSLEDFNLKEL